MRKGEEVICLDNFLSGSRLNLRQWDGHPSFKIIEHDITHEIEIEACRIWHLACPASPLHYQKEPIRTLKTNFIGTLNMLELARKSNAKFLLASTSEIYGNPKEHPQDENYNGSVNPFSERSCYQEGKRIAESLCFDYQRVHKVSICIARIFNSYGPKMLVDDGRVISNFICNALNNKPLCVNGDGSQTRSFCYINDLIEGLTKLMDSNYNKPINLGCDQELKILEIAKLISTKVSSKTKIVYKELPQDEPMRRKPDINLAKKVLQWEPRTDIKKGLDYTIEYFKNTL